MREHAPQTVVAVTIYVLTAERRLEERIILKSMKDGKKVQKWQKRFYIDGRSCSLQMKLGLCVRIVALIPTRTEDSPVLVENGHGTAPVLYNGRNVWLWWNLESVGAEFRRGKKLFD
jgi:hypothetical protein